MKSKIGFTLIELLVVISIIMMFASMLLASINQATEKARDSRRLRDIKTLQTVINMYQTNNNGDFPPVDADNSTLPNFLSNLIIEKYLPQKLVDPLNNTEYYYRYLTDESITTYCTMQPNVKALIMFRLENINTPYPKCGSTPPNSLWSCNCIE
ncbi:MAG: type II secretion system protein [Minisyncoccia bacterium]